jgi:hypothetical protein
MRTWQIKDSKNPGHYSLPFKSQLFDKKPWKTVLTELSSSKPNFSKITLVTGILHKIGMVELNFSSNGWVSLLLKQRLEHGNIRDSWLWTPNCILDFLSSFLNPYKLRQRPKVFFYLKNLEDFYLRKIERFFYACNDWIIPWCTCVLSELLNDFTMSALVIELCEILE